MFGVAFNYGGVANDTKNVTSIFLFVGVTALLLGAVFGRNGFRCCVISGSFALLLMSLPLIYFDTTESLIAHAIELLVLLLFLALTNLVGTRINPTLVSMSRKWVG